ncbi:helix-turn-helix domain-containing protein [Methylomicrobium lacus]|uniref:helix-turn-helix domain-containing protein n=1 Tax=Methylomicrobium lacus TaxID=136992 RepID=UPI0035A937AE
MNQQEIKVKLLLNKAEASAALSVSVRTLEKMTNDGIIKPVKVGGRVLFRVSDLESFVESLGDGSAKEEKKPRGRPRLAV